MASLKFYIIIIVTYFVLVLFHYPKYFWSLVWQDFTFVDNQGKKEIALRARENRISFGPRPKFRNRDRLETAKSPKKSVPYWPNIKEIFSDSVRYLG